MSNSAVTDEFDVHPREPFGLVVQAKTKGTPVARVPTDFVLEKAREHRLLVLRDFTRFTSPDDLIAFGGTLGTVAEWDFGAVLDLVEQVDPADGVFGSNWLPYHWDGMFFEQVPEFQVFNCIAAPGENQGGRTVFCDTTLALSNVDPAVRAEWAKVEAAYSIGTVAHYGGGARSPLIVPHPDSGVPTLRYHEPVPTDMDYPNPITIRLEGVAEDRVAHIQQSLKDALYDRRNYQAHDWHEGDIVIADNYTMLHGREAFTSRASRHLRRLHVMGNPPLENPALRAA
jgi:alpha-ketoglutarate-dependent taurine dioxygenase